ncbi:winged helix-turn-helix domain-containing protein [Streptosporangium sp. NPDC051023]|uniref:winged helix-turn-helix domain-containing protein n=1 Tax=Streptosporangium sp. NPDC051023 TaxID=3155410 RepID=UPI00344DBFED
MIEYDPTEPKWRQIYAVVRRRIESGEYAPKSLVSEVKLEAEFGVTRTTIRKVTAQLREDGLIITRPSMGSFVTDQEVRSAE